ncbi:AMP-binding enzyme [Streptosporangium sp. NBC_01469]|uniref:AMP-binding enzyme n=1 Tax=Streptosporangium sp. NBC_01469 TaxID=2903898 RepID=UPI003FCE27A1
MRGFRVELGEIETLLTSMPSVAEAVVAVVGEDAEDQRLRAFVVATSLPFDRAEVLAMLRDKVPAHMVPSHIEVVSSFPRTPSGKLDRLAVATPATVPGSAPSPGSGPMPGSPPPSGSGPVQGTETGAIDQ